MTTPYEKLAQEFCQKIEPTLESRRDRTFPAKIRDEKDTILSQGEARFGSDCDFLQPGAKLVPRSANFGCLFVKVSARYRVRTHVEAPTGTFRTINAFA
jgi:hypothetical protein